METIAENVKHVLNEGCAADKVILQHMDEHIRFTMRQRMMLKRALVERTGEAVPFAFSNDSLGFNEICLIESQGNYTIRHYTKNAFKGCPSCGKQWISYDDPETVF